MSTIARSDRETSADEIVIQPSSGWMPVNLREVWNYRELLYFLTWRDVKVRYKQTVIGAAWAIIQPFFTMVVFSVFFGHLAKMPSDGIPYPIFVYCALLPWQLFAHALAESSNSIVGSQHLITKVYFPRLVVPIAAVCGGLMDFAIGFLVLPGMMAFYGILPVLAVLTLPLFVLFAVVTALAAHLEVHDFVLVAERRVDQQVEMGAHPAHRGTVRAEQEDDGSVHL